MYLGASLTSFGSVGSHFAFRPSAYFPEILHKNNDQTECYQGLGLLRWLLLEGEHDYPVEYQPGRFESIFDWLWSSLCREREIKDKKLGGIIWTFWKYFQPCRICVLILTIIRKYESIHQLLPILLLEKTNGQTVVGSLIRWWRLKFKQTLPLDASTSYIPRGVTLLAGVLALRRKYGSVPANIFFAVRQEPFRLWTAKSVLTSTHQHFSFEIFLYCSIYFRSSQKIKSY